MQLYHEYSSVMHTNTYIVVEGRQAIVVDPGDTACVDAIKMKLDALGARLSAILITHAHFDHIAGVAKLKQLYEDDSPKVYTHKESVAYISGKKNLGKYMGVKVEPFEPDVLLEGGEKLNIAGLDINVIYTPGHSKDGVCYRVKDRIFTGDTLFFCTYGRTDLFDGDFDTLKDSAMKLFALTGNYVLLPGHGEPTTLEFERRNNPILTDNDDESMDGEGEEEAIADAEDKNADADDSDKNGGTETDVDADDDNVSNGNDVCDTDTGSDDVGDTK